MYLTGLVPNLLLYIQITDILQLHSQKVTISGTFWFHQKITGNYVHSPPM